MVASASVHDFLSLVDGTVRHLDRPLLILDRSPVFLGWMKEQVERQCSVTEWLPVMTPNDAPTVSLLDTPPTPIVHVDSPRHVKTLVQRYSTRPTMAPCLMLCSVSRQSTRKLEQCVSAMGGYVVTGRDTGKNGDVDVTHKMLSSLHLNPHTATFLADYVRGDYDTIVGVVRALSVLTPAQQHRVSVDDMVIRLPQKPGSIPPWTFTTPLSRGDAAGAISEYFRIVDTCHPLVPVSILVSRMTLIHSFASAIATTGASSLSSAARTIGAPSAYPSKIAFSTAQRIGYTRSRHAAWTAASLSGNLKGGSRLKASVLVPLALSSIADDMR